MVQLKNGVPRLIDINEENPRAVWPFEIRLAARYARPLRRLRPDGLRALFIGRNAVHVGRLAVCERAAVDEFTKRGERLDMRPARIDLSRRRLGKFASLVQGEGFAGKEPFETMSVI